MNKIAILGSGDFGTALVCNLIQSNDIWWYVRSEEAIEHIQKTGHHSHLSAHEIKPYNVFDSHNIHMISDINSAISEADIIFIVIPTAYIKEEWEKITTSTRDKIFVIMSKGFVESQLISDYLIDQGINDRYIYTLAGPCHAEEMIQGKRNYLTLGTPVIDNFSHQIINIFPCDNNTIHIASGLRDVIQLVSALKNIYAISAGISDALNNGDNFKAILTTQAFKEIETIASHYAGFLNMKSSDILTSYACLGDLLVTCYSTHSRNYAYGRSLVQRDRGLIYKPEGYYTIQQIFEMIDTDLSIKLPLLRFVYSTIFEWDYPHSMDKIIQ